MYSNGNITNSTLITIEYPFRGLKCNRLYISMTRFDLADSFLSIS